jgi:hypothetical protein
MILAAYRRPNNSLHRRLSPCKLANQAGTEQEILQVSSFRPSGALHYEQTQVRSSRKAAIVALLAVVLCLSPALAITLGRMFRFIWPGFRSV